MTRGEVLAVMKQIIKEQWDDRSWDLALKTNDPVDTYDEQVKRQQSIEDADKVEDLPQAQQDWLRATKHG